MKFIKQGGFNHDANFLSVFSKTILKIPYPYAKKFYDEI